MPDITDLLDAAIGPAPATAPGLEPTLVLGRRALRRRRVSYGVGAAATALVLGGSAWALSPGGNGDAGRDSTPVTNQSTAAAPTSSVPESEPWGDDELVRVLADGTYETNPEAEVAQTSTILVGEVPTRIWVLRLDGQSYYALAEPDGSVQSQPATAAQGLDVGEWATETLDPDAATILPDDGFVRFDTGSHLVGAEGVEIVQQVPDPGLGERFAAPGEPTALAEVTYAGVTWFLAVRATDGGPTETIPYRKDRQVSTFAEFADYAARQYATNDEGGSEGMR